MKLAKAVLVFLFTCSPLAGSKQNLYLHANLEQCGYDSFGMFSVFNYVTGVLFTFDSNSYVGIEVDFEHYGLYYDPEYGLNWWEYYCEPIRIGSKEGTYIKKFNRIEYTKYAYFTERKLTRHAVHNLIQKYIKPNEGIRTIVDQFVLENFTGYHIVGIHYRGTDKDSEAPRVSFDLVSEMIQNYLSDNDIQNYRIFVATDESQFIEFMENSFPGAVIVYSKIHSHDGTPLHLSNSSPYLHGKEAFIDCLLLSQGDILFRTSSNLSLWSTYFNPLIPVIELNERTEKYNKFIDKIIDH